MLNAEAANSKAIKGLIEEVHLADLCPNAKSYTLCQELLEAEAANSKAIEDVIEEERAKVDARTPITEEARTCRVEASIMLMPQQRNMRVQMQGSSSCRAALLEVHGHSGRCCTGCKPPPNTLEVPADFITLCAKV